MRWQRAKCVYDASRESFLQLSSVQTDTETIVSEETIHKWLDEESSIVTSHAFGKFYFTNDNKTFQIYCAGSLPPWKSEYFLLLNPFFKWR